MEYLLPPPGLARCLRASTGLAVVDCIAGLGLARAVAGRVNGLHPKRSHSTGWTTTARQHRESGAKGEPSLIQARPEAVSIGVVSIRARQCSQRSQPLRYHRADSHEGTPTEASVRLSHVRQ